jgi:hypothetical protein
VSGRVFAYEYSSEACDLASYVTNILVAMASARNNEFSLDLPEGRVVKRIEAENRRAGEGGISDKVKGSERAARGF